MPSIVVGLWGLYVMQPVFLRDVEPFLKKIPVIELLFKGNAEGAGYILAGFVLSIMIVPTMVALSRTALAGVGTTDREAAFALGMTLGGATSLSCGGRSDRRTTSAASLTGGALLVTCAATGAGFSTGGGGVSTFAFIFTTGGAGICTVLRRRTGFLIFIG